MLLRMQSQLCNCHHTRHTGQDTIVVPCLRCGSFSYHKSVGGRAGSARSGTFFHSFLAKSVASTRRILCWSQRSSLIWFCLSPCLYSNAIACEFLCKATPFAKRRQCLRVLFRMISGTFVVFFIPSACRTVFFGHAEHAHSVRRWCWSAALCSAGGGCQSRVAPCTDGTSPAPMATCPGTSCWEAFQTQRLERASRSAHRRHGPRC